MVLKRGTSVVFCGHTFKVAGMHSKAGKMPNGDRIVNCDITLSGVRTLVMNHRELESKLEDGSMIIQ